MGRTDLMSDGLIIKTDNIWWDFVYRTDVPKRILESESFWMGSSDEESDEEYFDGFLFYKGSWYHLSMFERTSGKLKDLGWDGYIGDSYFSGVVIKWSSDGERYKIGTYSV